MTRNIRCKQIIVSNLLVILTFIGAAIGFGIGIGVRQFSPSESALMWIGILGEMYLNLLKMMIVPLVACSVISGEISSTKSIDGSRRTNIQTEDIFADLLSCMLGIAAGAAKEIGRQFAKFFYSATEVILLLLGKIICAVAMPSVIQQLEGPNHVDNKISRFVCPLNAAIGRCGSCLYICVSCLFIMQMVDRNIDAATVILVCILTTFSSLAIPAVAGASLVTVIILLTALGIPAEEVSLLYAFEWFLDRMRSTTNVFVQGLCGVITNKMCQSSLKILEKSSENNVVYEKEIVTKEKKDITVSSNIIPDSETSYKRELFNEKL
ncbi:unnamed protein product [Mytilus coruscus]|uniref:Amino acid transporter n=1 Tax=Mytilus coruscus TaxID=42192 RepID=A0A6J8DP35_MYTCO|nr:unnamed protein product [Mytilus coruscus]